MHAVKNDSANHSTAGTVLEHLNREDENMQ